MNLALYRKYRPQKFADLAGQHHIKTTLQNAISSEKVAHCYLFSGPRGLGKTTTARLLSKALNCRNRKDDQSEPCNECELCIEIAKGNSIDVVEIDAASQTSVENVRSNIIEDSRFAPTKSKYKIFIIDEVHMLSLSAFNALLKTLEEPPAHTVFILATTELHKVPQTIVSRCQHFQFRTVLREEIIARLQYLVKQEKREVDDEVYDLVAYASGGSIRDAESMMGQILSISNQKIKAEQAELILPMPQHQKAFDLVEILTKRDTVGALDFINGLVNDGISLKRFTADLVEVLRLLLLLKVDEKVAKNNILFSSSLTTKAQMITKGAEVEFFIKTIEVILTNNQKTPYTEILQLPLELAILEICSEKKQDNEGENLTKSSQQAVKTLPVKSTSAVEKPSPQQTEKIKSSDKSVVVIKKEEPRAVAVEISEIVDQWEEILKLIEKDHHSLSNTLKLSQLGDINAEGQLEIFFSHRFHQQRIAEAKNREVVEAAISAVVKQNLAIIPKIGEGKIQPKVVKKTKAAEMDKPLDTDPLNGLVESFGGQLLD